MTTATNTLQDQIAYYQYKIEQCSDLLKADHVVYYAGRLAGCIKLEVKRQKALAKVSC